MLYKGRIVDGVTLLLDESINKFWMDPKGAFVVYVVFMLMRFLESIQRFMNDFIAGKKHWLKVEYMIMSVMITLNMQLLVHIHK